jgi:hypothetical protein
LRLFHAASATPPGVMFRARWLNAVARSSAPHASCSTRSVPSGVTVQASPTVQPAAPQMRESAVRRPDAKSAAMLTSRSTVWTSVRRRSARSRSATSARSASFVRDSSSRDGRVSATGISGTSAPAVASEMSAVPALITPESQ